MLQRFRDWQRQRIISRCHIDAKTWAAAIDELRVLDRLTAKERENLTQLAILFLHDKEIVGAGELVIDDNISMIIALQACLPILYLGLEWYAGWRSVIVYPSGFTHERKHTDENGITHTDQTGLSGEAWLRGPVVLSWDSAQGAAWLDGHNVVIHEFVHKLDMLNGRANGFPPMQPDMNPRAWSEIFHAAFEDFQVNPRAGIDRYAATNSAEFLAVLGELFFERADVVYATYPAVYTELSRFFRQDPLGKRAID